jgi:hypothetical protein
MNDKVVYLHEPPPRIAQYLRIGTTGYRHLEHLLSAGKLLPERFVVNAASCEKQIDLVTALQGMGRQIVLDSNAAELSAIGRYGGAMRDAPWAQAERPLEQDDFIPGTNRSIIEPIARFAVEKKVSEVFSPTHFITDARDSWLSISNAACRALRDALDREGGREISIDYPLIISYGLLRDSVARKIIVRQLSDLPFDRLWLRVSGFGADARPAGIGHYINAAYDFHELGRPIIGDHIGGLAGLALVAFGGASGFSHGAGSAERFYAGDWNKLAGEGRGNGKKRIYTPGLDRQVYVSDLRELFKSSRSARSILGCTDKKCCKDIEAMLKDPEAHYLKQRNNQIRDIERAPSAQRPSRLLDEHVASAERVAKKAARLRSASEPMKKIFAGAEKRIGLMHDVLGNLDHMLGGAPPVPPPVPPVGAHLRQDETMRYRP